MTTRELMIGNYVMAIKNYEDIFYVNCIYGYRDLNITSGIYKNYDTTIRDVKPIPLTEEWLLKFGFKNHLDTIWIHWSKESGLFQISTRLPQGSYGLWINGTMGCFEYVHQLQNLFFALTGEELTIKNK